MKVKILSNSSIDVLEMDINNFLDELSDAVIIDIKYSSDMSESNYSIHRSYSTMIMYE